MRKKYSTHKKKSQFPKLTRKVYSSDKYKNKKTTQTENGEGHKQLIYGDNSKYSFST